MSQKIQQEGSKSEEIRISIETLVRNFKSELQSDELRQKVLALVPIFKKLRKLGKSLIPTKYAASARDRILYYFLKYPNTVLNGYELLVVSGIQEYARRVRELRVQFGWSIVTGITIKEMIDAEEEISENLIKMKPDEYILLNANQDRDAAHRWNIANSIRKESLSVRDKILKFLLENVGKPVTNEELRYVAGNKTEWARRVRELRTEYGWPVATKTTGRPDLQIGEYVLLSDRQAPEHDRQIPDNIRREVLRRDSYKCFKCRWSHDEWNPSDPRHLEIHHIEPHVQGGRNEKENLRTLCTVCHDKEHHI